MTDGIGRIFGGSNYGVGGYVPQRKNEEAADAQTQAGNAQPQNEETKVDPQKVMDFLANNNYFMPVTDIKPAVEPEKADPELEDRIAGYMERFELIYAEFDDVFGPELAPAAFDIALNKLMSLVA